MRLKNKLIILVIILLVVIGLVYIFPQKINKEYRGIQYRIGNDSDEVSIVIHMNGYITRGLLQGDRFQGSITIGEKELPKLDMRFSDDGGALLLYYDEASGDYSSYGHMYMDYSREKISISIFESNGQENGKKSWSSKDGFIISAPAKNINEAIEITNELIKYLE
jgi:hypothetical protein